MRKRIYLFTALLGLLLTVACSGSSDATANTGAKTPASYSGSITVAGSSTVYPIAELASSQFKSEGFPGSISIESIGSSAGLERFCGGLPIDIASASRHISEGEISACRQNGREPVEIQLGTDALVVVVNSQNEFAQNLSYKQVELLFSTATQWSDIDPSWPKEPIARFIPSIKSGTFDFFVEEMFNGNPERILNSSRLEFSENDEFLATSIGSNPYAVGFFGYGYFLNHIDMLRALQIDGIQPNATNVTSETYPLVRPLLLYTSDNILQSKPQVNAYVTFMLNRGVNLVEEVGYFPMDEIAYRDMKNQLASND